ncbi:ArsR/SmtB family transcription factor [Streptomyces sp. NPDC093089]|uniref:ArsR/SmtB family transcription factor n=1 Tax=Streptomyces sp. NPDC093089 TaxID=3366024 RepID=UPI00381E714F
MRPNSPTPRGASEPSGHPVPPTPRTPSPPSSGARGPCCSPSSTTQLATHRGLSAAGVSQHLIALRNAGLVTAHRSGRSVLYARTAVADQLLNP